MDQSKIKEVLKTPRLTLRKFRNEDVEAVYKYGQQVQTLKYLVWQGVASKEEALECIEGYYLSRPGIYAIALKESDLCIGAIDLRFDEDNNKASFGYLLDEDYWNLGYMSEVLLRVLEHCFDDLKLNRVESTHYKNNPASGKVMAKCKMKLEGMGIEEVKVKGIYHDVIHYGITYKMWQNR